MKAIIKLSIITFLASWLGQSCNSNPSDLPEFVTFSEVTASAIALDSFYHCLFRAIKQLLAKDIITQPSHGKYTANA